MRQDHYTVELEVFHGPLDLLLFLIRRAEVDILDIPIARLTDDYLAFLRSLDSIDIEEAGDFLVMAATLMEIKSRMLMPPPAPQGEDGAADAAGPIDANAGLNEADPRYELVCQLLAYKRYRDAAENLDDRRRQWSARFAAARAAVPLDADKSDGEAMPGSSLDSSAQEESPQDDMSAAPDQSMEIEDTSIWDLCAAFGRIIEAVDFGRLGDHRIQYDETPVALHQQDLLDQIRRAQAGELSLRAAFQGRTRSEMIGLFLATLELVRESKVRVVQGHLRDDILLIRCGGEIENEDDAAQDEQ